MWCTLSGAGRTGTDLLPGAGRTRQFPTASSDETVSCRKWCLQDLRLHDRRCGSLLRGEVDSRYASRFSLCESLLRGWGEEAMWCTVLHSLPTPTRCAPCTLLGWGGSRGAGTDDRSIFQGSGGRGLLTGDDLLSGAGRTGTDDLLPGAGMTGTDDLREDHGYVVSECFRLVRRDSVVSEMVLSPGFASP